MALVAGIVVSADMESICSNAPSRFRLLFMKVGLRCEVVDSD